MVGDQQVHASRGINLNTGAGEYVSIIGPSGSGKPTLLNLIGLAAGVMPARRAAMMGPVEALRAE